jgi:hypothetical protein
LNPSQDSNSMLTLSSSRLIFLGNSTVALMSDDEFGDMTLI